MTACASKKPNTEYAAKCKIKSLISRARFGRNSEGMEDNTNSRTAQAMAGK